MNTKKNILKMLGFSTFLLTFQAFSSSTYMKATIRKADFYTLAPNSEFSECSEIAETKGHRFLAAKYSFTGKAIRQTINYVLDASNCTQGVCNDGVTQFFRKPEFYIKKSDEIISDYQSQPNNFKFCNEMRDKAIEKGRFDIALIDQTEVLVSNLDALVKALNQY